MSNPLVDKILAEIDAALDRDAHYEIHEATKNGDNRCPICQPNSSPSSPPSGDS